MLILPVIFTCLGILLDIYTLNTYPPERTSSIIKVLLWGHYTLETNGEAQVLISKFGLKKLEKLLNIKKIAKKISKFSWWKMKKNVEKETLGIVSVEAR
jgi:hypothetical protein